MNITKVMHVRLTNLIQYILPNIAIQHVHHLWENLKSNTCHIN